VALPKGPAGRFTVGLSNSLSIFKDAKNKDLAKELLIYLTETSWYQKWIDVGAPLTLPVFSKLAETDPVWKDPYNKALLDSQNSFRFLGYEGPYTPEAGKVANLRLMNVMFEDIIANKVPIETALRNFITEANKAIQ
jgi:multiple sugar transport system substrate-binding protein